MATDKHGMGIPLPADSTKIHEFPAITRQAIDAIAAILAGGLTGELKASIVGELGRAIGPAVDDQIEQRGLLEGVAEVDGLPFSITDEAGRRSWLEIDFDGGPSAPALQMLLDRIQATFGLPEIALNTDTAMLSILDSDRRRSWLEIGADGRPTEHARKLIFEGYEPGGAATDTAPDYPLIKAGGLYMFRADTGNVQRITGPGNQSNPRNPSFLADGTVFYETDGGTFYLSPGTSAAYPVTPNRRLAFWGDSLTDSGGPDYYPTRAAEVLGVPFYQGGVSGQASADIALRQGGLQPAITLAGNQIPFSGPVAVSKIEPAAGYRVSADGNYTFEGTLRGVPGTLTHDMRADTWTFTRTASGPAVSVPAGSRFTGADAAAHENDIQVLWAGRNNINPGVNLGHALRDTAAMVSFLKPYQKQFVVLSVTNGTGERRSSSANYQAIVNHNKTLKETYGARFYDLRRDFIDRGLAMAGITPTAEDLANISDDAPPPSLMNDGLHPTPAGYRVIGELVAAFITSKGWL